MQGTKNIVGRAAFALLALGWLVIPAIAEPPVLPDDVRENVVQRVDDKFSASVVIGMVNADGVVYFAHGTTALSGGVTPDENTVYEIGSISKVFTGTLLADMVEKGTVALEDPVARHLPDEVSVPARGETPIRLVDLATHRSGLPRMPDNVDPADPLNPYADYTVEDLYEFLGSHELARDVGEGHEYSNLGMGLLGHVLERISGKTYEQLVGERIAGPLGMASTGITLTPELKERMVRPHAMTIEVEPWDIPTLAGAGALRSTAKDMVAFLAANMGLRVQAGLKSLEVHSCHNAR